jgi:hypothetical protein
MRSSWPTKPARWRAEDRKPGKFSAVPAQAAAQARDPSLSGATFDRQALRIGS